MQRQGVNNISVKRINLDAVYWFIYVHRQVSVRDIVTGLNLSLPTVTQNLKQLMALGLVVSKGVMDSTGGRKARAYTLNNRTHFTLGLDITRRRVGLVLLDLSGNIAYHVRHSLTFQDVESYYAAVGHLARCALDCLGLQPSDVLGAGISLPAILSGDGSHAVNAGPLGVLKIARSSLEAFLPFACALCNDANAGGFADFWAMSSAGNFGGRSLAYLSVSDTVGGSIMIDGRMYTGLHQHSAEFGHMTLIPGGEKCYCGQLGCAYAYLNTRRLAEMAGGELESFFQRLEAGEPRFLEVWDQYLDYLALAINNIRIALDLDIIIGGYLGRYIGPYMAELKRRAGKRNMFEGTGDYLLASTQVCEAAAVGAALMQQYVQVKRLLGVETEETWGNQTP